MEPTFEIDSVRTGQWYLPTASITGVLLFLATAQAPEKHWLTHDIHWEKTDSTIGISDSGENLTVKDILQALAKIHDSILKDAVELNIEARALLYRRLWDLYA